MKKSVFLSAAVLCSLTLAACTPKDAAIVTPEQRENLDARNKARQSGNREAGRGGGAVDFKSTFAPRDSVRTSFIVQKHAEALEILSLVLGTQDISQSAFEKTVSETEGTDSGVSLKPKEEQTRYGGVFGDVGQKNLKVYSVQTSLEATTGNLVTVEAKDLKTFSNLVDKKRFFVNHKESSYSLVLAKENGELTLTVVSEGVIEGAKGAQMDSFPSTIELKMILDPAVLSSSQFVIKKIDSKMSYPSPQGDKLFYLNLKGTDVQANMRSFCPELAGAMTFKTKDESSFTVDADKITLPKFKNLRLPFATCGKRPAMDLTVLLDN